MSLDIKYRPRVYDDVLGQTATITILRQYVAQGKGFRQSYLFCGGHGSGKTTLGRILARALLCASPVEGNPCDECSSCRSLLTLGTSADFVEVDAATNSGKADVTKITEEIGYATFSGKRRIYLFDESHRLSENALDALLKPLEDTLPGSEDKRLTCIFCTTEPEKMRATVLSRCAPAFVIRPQTPALIAERLQHICGEEDIVFEPEMLRLIAEITECHIRDALKAVEGVSMLGGVTPENVTSYLHLDLNAAYLDLLDAIGNDLPAALKAARQIMERASPLTCYEKLAEVSMLAYRISLGEKVSSYWSRDRLSALGGAQGIKLLGFASRFASRPGRPTAAMLMMDIAHLHHVGGSPENPAVVFQVQEVSDRPAVPPSTGGAAPPTPTPTPTPSESPAREEGRLPGTMAPPNRDWIEAEQGKASRRRPLAAGPKAQDQRSPTLTPEQFSELLGHTLASSSGGPTR